VEEAYTQQGFLERLFTPAAQRMRSPKKTGFDDWALVRQLPFLGPWALQQLSVPAQHRFQLWKLHGLLSMPEQLTTTALSGSRSNNQLN
jgi:hypothetical protein